MPVRYGIIGCGSIAQWRHIPECHANPDSVVAALCDPVRERVEALAEQYGAESYTDYRKMLAAAKLDAVVVCGPNHLHAAQTIDALKAGKHVLCEKPMATSRADAKRMIATAKRRKKYLMVAMNQRLIGLHVRAKEILKSGRLGHVLSVRTAFKHPGPEAWSADGAASWFFKKRSAFMGVTGDLGIHKVDLVRWLLDEEFAEIGGYISTLDKRDASGKKIALDDNAYLTFKMKSGVLGSMILSWTNYGPEENYTVVYCSDGVLSIGTDPEYGVVVTRKGGDQELHRVGGIGTNENPIASGVIDALTSSIRRRRAPTIDGTEGYRSLDVILTAMAAAREGKTLRIGR